MDVMYQLYEQMPKHENGRKSAVASLQTDMHILTRQNSPKAALITLTIIFSVVEVAQDFLRLLRQVPPECWSFFISQIIARLNEPVRNPPSRDENNSDHLSTPNYLASSILTTVAQTYPQSVLYALLARRHSVNNLFDSIHQYQPELAEDINRLSSELLTFALTRRERTVIIAQKFRLPRIDPKILQLPRIK
jgi:hypothetical protein